MNFWLTTVLLPLALTACGYSPDNGAEASKNEWKFEEHTSGGSPTISQVPPESVMEDGCLNIQTLFSKLSGMPASILMRRFTYDYELSSNEPIRRNFALQLAYDSFTYRESTVHELVDEFSRVRQSGCDSVELARFGEDLGELAVESATESRLVIRDRNGRRFDFHLSSPSILNLRYSRPVKDTDCESQTAAVLQYFQTVRWGGMEVFRRSTETIATPFLQRLVEAANTPGLQFDRSLFWDSSMEYVVSVSHLKALQAAPIKRKVLRCGLPSHPASEEPERDEGDPGDETGVDEELEIPDDDPGELLTRGM